MTLLSTTLRNKRCGISKYKTSNKRMGATFPPKFRKRRKKKGKRKEEEKKKEREKKKKRERRRGKNGTCEPPQAARPLSAA